MVLAALCLDPGATVAADGLAELIWADDLPENWVGALQSHVSRLRRELPDDVELLADGVGYRLAGAGTADIDAVELAAAHRRAVDSSSVEDQLESCESGLSVWNGVPFQDLDDAAALAERSRLSELAAGLREMKIDALVALGRRREAIAELESIRSSDPLRERTAGQLMHVLMAEGRISDALAAYADLKSNLVEELGLDPSPELRELRDSIVMETYVSPLAPGGKDLASAGRTETPAPSSTATPLDDLVGRDDEIERLLGLLRAPGLVTLVGPGGVGKTRLAFSVAHPGVAGFDRVDVVELAQVADDSAVGEAVASEMGIPAQSGLDAPTRVATALGSRDRLLVLDNCEHVIDAAAGFVDRLSRLGGPVHVLATSREPLNVHGESVVRLQPLGTGDAMDLLVRRIEDRGTACPTGAAAGELLRRVARAVDRLPLGIELAAAHCDTMTLEEIADAVVEPLELLSRGRRTAETRHRSLRALVEWSVRDLDDLQREVFSCAAAFAGPFTAGALSTVTGRCRVETRQALADLVDRSLVASGEGPAGRMLHSMMATVRAYAREMLAASEEEHLVEERHAQWVMELVEPWAADLRGWREAERMHLVDTHLADLRVAHRRFVDRGDAERSVLFAASLHHMATYRMHAELFAWIGETAERFGDADVPGTEAVLASAAVGAWATGAMQRSAHLAQRAAAVNTSSLGRGIGSVEVLADLAGFDGDNDEAIRLFDEGLAVARADGNECREFSDLADGAIHHAYGDDLDSAQRNITAARELLGPDGPRAAHAWVDYVEGEALAEQDAHAALVCLRRAVDGATATSSDFIVGVARLTLAGLETRVGSLDAAASDLAALLRHWRSAGAHLQQWITLRSVLSFLVARGDHVTAARTLGVLTSDRNLAEITGPDAARLAEARHLLTSRGAEDQFGDWRDRTIDEVVDELLTVLAPPVGVSRASTW